MQIAPPPTYNRTNKSGSLVDVLDIVGVGSIGLFDAIFRTSGLMCYTGMKSLHDEVSPPCRLQRNEDESDFFFSLLFHKKLGL